ncbi:hypothetical protein SmJEL517_g03591 [Synchytrium microbalum]|uniref:3-dehydrosphinganine reductase n=1 Tax=Synchytrium microbalum TaxID=1806994 RepID=A0A507C267_9FUNG|nr:uncharacterized protein SmJEL517_g03591 [Synchytrium microbalum]TPX33511.1 hypothetical protein SmJEL517_g03591 [Synchytrium microbalum]
MFNLAGAFQQFPGEIVVSVIVVLVSFRVLPLVYCIGSFLIASRPASPSALAAAVTGKHIVISGASAGLGLSTAFALAQAGAKLTLIARGTDRDAQGKSRLDHAVEACLQRTSNVGFVACDVADYAQLVAGLSNAVKERGDIDWVIANAGASVPGFLMDQIPTDGDTSVLDYMLNVNSKGPAHLIQAVLSVAAAHSKSSVKISGIPIDTSVKMPERIVLVGSQVCCVGFIGYTAYAASKFALRGYTDALRSEMVPFDTQVQLFLPGNMDTPGFLTENKTKPAITAKIEGTISTLSADSAASVMLGGILSNRYYITSDIIGELIRIYAHGMVARRPNPLAEIMAMPLLTTIFYIFALAVDMDTRGYGRAERAKLR